MPLKSAATDGSASSKTANPLAMALNKGEGFLIKQAPKEASLSSSGPCTRPELVAALPIPRWRHSSPAVTERYRNASQHGRENGCDQERCGAIRAALLLRLRECDRAVRKTGAALGSTTEMICPEVKMRASAELGRRLTNRREEAGRDAQKLRSEGENFPVIEIILRLGGEFPRLVQGRIRVGIPARVAGLEQGPAARTNACARSLAAGMERAFFASRNARHADEDKDGLDH